MDSRGACCSSGVAWFLLDLEPSSCPLEDNDLECSGESDMVHEDCLKTQSKTMQGR